MGDATHPVLITGATGFVGSALVQRMATEHGLRPRAATRRATAIGGAEVVNVGELSPTTDWSMAVDGVRSVVHLAARVHVMRESSADPLQEFRRMNVEATERLARQAASAGAGRFVYVSSIKVNGEETRPGRRFTSDDAPAPGDAYGVSKHEAEQMLARVGVETGMEIVVVRPPLVYGPGVKANFRTMMSWLRRGVPLPFGAIHNKRSLVGLDNLVDLLIACVRSPAAAGQTFLVSDGEDLSTSELLRRLGEALGRPARLISIPAPILNAGLGAIGRRGIAQRLLGSLQVDISVARERLGWSPPFSVDHNLGKAASDFLAATTSSQ